MDAGLFLDPDLIALVKLHHPTDVNVVRALPKIWTRKEAVFSAWGGLDDPPGPESSSWRWQTHIYEILECIRKIVSSDCQTQGLYGWRILA